MKTSSNVKLSDLHSTYIFTIKSITCIYTMVNIFCNNLNQKCFLNTGLCDFSNLYVYHTLFDLRLSIKVFVSSHKIFFIQYF